MEIGVLLALLALVALVGFAALFPAAPEAGTGRRRDYRRHGCASEAPFRAVSIQPSQTCCTSVAGLRDQRFLSEDAPPLPLPGCGHTACRCRYIHHSDRRSGARDRRLSQLIDAVQQQSNAAADRRRSPGRRATDLQPA